MAHRDRDYDDRESFYTTTSSGPPRRRRAGSDTEIYERYEELRREEPARRAPVRDRERDDDDSRLPSFMRDDYQRRRPAPESSGTLVLRQREESTAISRPRQREESTIISRPRPRSPSQVRFQEERTYIRRARSPSRSPSPPPVRERVEVRDTRVVERERERDRRSPSVERIRSSTRIIDNREPSPHPIRYVQRGRSASRERERIRIIERETSRERAPSPSPSPPPPPPVPEVIQGPTIHREIITHYKNIDHGTIHVPKPIPSPRPILKPARDVEVTRDTEIDISRSRGHTDVEIHETRRRRSLSRDRAAMIVPRPREASPARVVETERSSKLRVDIEGNRRSTSIRTEHRKGHAHTHSLPPTRRPDYLDEEERLTSRIDSRGRMGEAWNGATRDWTIVDVPPGTERVRMDGVGGGAAEVTWQRYNGVRRSRFVPERERDRDDDSYTSLSDRDRDWDRDRERDRTETDRLAVQITDKRHTEVEIEKTRRKARRSDDMWTEITKDLVCRDAILEMGYDFEETEYFFYVMQYLRYEDVLRLVEISDDIRRHRKRHIREIEYERDYRDTEYRRSSRRRSDKYYDREIEVDVNREVVYDRPPVRGYLR